jgi:hypothetical protein
MLTWASAQDYRQPGLLKDVVNAWPTLRGYQSAGAIVNDTTATFPNEVFSGVSAIRPNGLYVGFVSEYAATSRIRRYSDGADVSRGGAYTGFTYFCYATTADYVYATNGTDPLQRTSLATLGNFADVTNCPRFNIIILSGGRLWGFNTTASITYAPFSYPANSSRWWVSAVGGLEDFAPSVATGASTDLLDDQDGEITAAIDFNGFPLVFKKSAIYILEDDGAFVVERKIHSEFGCDNRDAVVKVDNRVYFLSNTNNVELCMFDGNTVTSLSRGVLSSVGVGITNIFATGSGGTTVASSLVAFHTQLATNGRYVVASQRLVPPGGGGQTVMTCLVYDTVTGRFGKVDHAASTVDSSGKAAQAIWTSANTSNIVCAYIDGATGNVSGGTMSSSVSPDETRYVVYREQRLGQRALNNSGKAYFIGAIPAGAVVTNGELPTATGASITLNNDGRWSGANITAQRHETTITLTDPHEITDIELDIASGGKDQAKPRGKQ